MDSAEGRHPDGTHRPRSRRGGVPGVRSRPAEVSEKAFQAMVVERLRLHGWRVYHTFDSRRSAPGFPDLIAVRGPRMLAIECKRHDGTYTPEQLEWLRAFAGVRVVDAFGLRPADDWSGFENLIS